MEFRIAKPREAEVIRIDKSNAIPVIEIDEEIVLHYDPCDYDSNTHLHNYIEIVYVQEGSGKQIVNGREYNVKRGDLLFINYGQKHMVKRNEKISNESDRGYMRLIDIMLKPEFIDRELLESRNAMEMLALSTFESFAEIEQLEPVVSFSGKDLVEIEYIVHHMWAEWHAKNINYQVPVKGYVLILLNKIFRQMREKQNLPVIQHMNRITPEIIEYIENHCHEKINLTELARMCFYNPTYFSKVFKETFGVKFIDFIQEKRVKKAIDMIENSPEINVEEVVKQVGFCDKKQFYRVFKKVTGETPGEFKLKVTHKKKEQKNEG